MKTLCLVLMTMIFASCDRVINSEYTYLKSEEGSSFCRRGMGFSASYGELNMAGGLGPGIKMNRSGSMKVVYDVYRVERTFESGEKDAILHRKIAKELTKCR